MRTLVVAPCKLEVRVRQESTLDRQTQGREPPELLATILEDMVKARKMRHDDWLALSKSPLEPLAIPISDGREYRVTQTGVDAAHELTGQIWEQRKDIRQRISRQAFDRLSFLAVGRSIRDSVGRLSEESAVGGAKDKLERAFCQELLADYSKTLDALAEKAGREVEQHIPSELFHADQHVPAFSVGPVDFRPRADWIGCFVRDPGARDIVERVERREYTVDDVRRQASAEDGGRAARDALTALTCLRRYSWVGTIRTSGHEFRRSHWKASIMVELAMDAVGLRFHAEEARRFKRAGHGHLYAEDRLATSVDDGDFIHGWSVQMPGLGSAPGELARRMREERGFLDAAGSILEVYLKDRQKGEAPLLVERWVNALHWVGEARREESDSMAVVKYGCAVDGLCGGEGDYRAITDFVKAALEPSENREPHGSALSVAEAVALVYGREGRSGLAHGGTPGLLEDFSKPRRVGDLLLASLFYPVTLGLADLIKEESPALTFGRKHAFRVLKERVQKVL